MKEFIKDVTKANKPRKILAIERTNVNKYNRKEVNMRLIAEQI